MEYSRYGHHHHRDEQEEYPPPARPLYDGPPPPQPSYHSANAPPPPDMYHRAHMGGAPPPPNVYHSAHVGGAPPPPNVYHSSHMERGGGYEYPPPASHHYPPQDMNYSSHASPVPVQHVSHEYPRSETESNPHHFSSHPPSFVHQHVHQPNVGSYLAAKPTVRVFTKAETNYSLTIRDGQVVLVPSDFSDPCQHWIKDEKYSMKVKDEQGFPSFSLVNKATGQAMKHSVGATHPVQLTLYNPDTLDESVLWTESVDLGDSYRTIRMVNNIRLNVDAFHGDKNHGGVHDCTKIVLWEWKKGDNQRWKIIPY